MIKPKSYISLKDASEFSGYSPYYLGQLIRSGKLPGKQVFQNVVWMTTEEDLRAYMEQKRRGVSRKGGVAVRTSIAAWFPGKGHAIAMPRLMTMILYGAIILCVGLFLLLFYALSSSYDYRMQQQALQQAQTRTNL